MDDAATSINWIGPLLGGLGVLVPVCIAALIAFRKGSAEVEKTARNGVIEEWRDVVDRCEKRCDEREEEIKVLRKELDDVKSELSALKRQVEDRETERIKERGETRQLERTVAELKKPDVEAIADAVVEKLADSPPIVTNPPKDGDC